MVTLFAVVVVVVVIVLSLELLPDELEEEVSESDDAEASSGICKMAEGAWVVGCAGVEGNWARGCEEPMFTERVVMAGVSWVEASWLEEMSVAPIDVAIRCVKGLHSWHRRWNRDGSPFAYRGSTLTRRVL